MGRSDHLKQRSCRCPDNSCWVNHAIPQHSQQQVMVLWIRPAIRGKTMITQPEHRTSMLLYQTTALLCYCIKPQHCFVTVSSHSTLYQATAVLYYCIKQQHLDATVSKHILKTCTNTAVKCCKKASSINPFILRGQAPLTHLLPQGPHIMSLAKWFSSTNRTAYDFLLEFQLVSYTDVKQVLHGDYFQLATVENSPHVTMKHKTTF